MKEKNIFSSLNPTMTFILGLVAGLLVICTIGFFILLANAMGDGDEAKKTSKSNTPTVLTNNNPAPSQPSQPTGGKVNVSVSEADHIQGNPDASVVIVEFSDYQCPFCSRFHPTIKQVLEEYGDQVAVVYKHFPLDSIHPEARPAAEAAECAADQGGDEAFWEFTDALFANQASLGQTLYEDLAEEMDLNVGEFTNCLSTDKFAGKVEADYQQGLQYGVTGTPGSFINGIPVKGALPYASIKQIIDEELNS